METGQHGVIDVIGGFIIARQAFFHFFTDSREQWDDDLIFAIMPPLSAREKVVIQRLLADDSAEQDLDSFLQLQGIA